MTRLVDIFLNLISINATSGNEKPVADFIKNFLADFNIEVSIDSSHVYSQSNTGNIICRKGGGGNILLLSHMDTARPTLSTKPLIEFDRITSDGTNILGVDNRAGISIILYTIENIFRNKIPVKNFTAVFTTCEESTLNGSRYVDLNGNIKSGFIFDSSLRPGNFINEACGAKNFSAKVIGKAAHSGIEPEKGINAIAVAANVLSKIQQGKIDDETTVNVGKICGGESVNVVADRVEIEGEIRSFSIEKIEQKIFEAKRLFSEECKKYSASFQFEEEWDFVPYKVSSDSMVYSELVSAMEKVGLKPCPNVSLAGSDANSLNEKGIPSINIGIGAQNPHSNEEFILLEDLHKSADLALELLKI